MLTFLFSRGFRKEQIAKDSVMKGVHRALLGLVVNHAEPPAVQIYQGREVLLMSALHCDDLCESAECIFANVDSIALFQRVWQNVCPAKQLDLRCWV